MIERAVDLAEHTERGLDWVNLANVVIGIHTYTDRAAVDASTADLIMPFGTTWRYRIRARSGSDPSKQSDNSYVDAEIPMPSGVPDLIRGEDIRYGGSYSTEAYNTQQNCTILSSDYDQEKFGATDITDYRVLRLGAGVTSWHDPDAVLVSSMASLTLNRNPSSALEFRRLTGSGTGFGGQSLCDSTTEAGETYIYIVQGKNGNGWNTQVVDEFNVIDTIGVTYLVRPGAAPPPPTEVEVDEQ